MLYHAITSSIHSLFTSYTGQLGTSMTGILLPTDGRVFNASAQLADEYPFNLDVNSGNPIGISKSQCLILFRIHFSLLSHLFNTGWAQTTVHPICSIIVNFCSYLVHRLRMVRVRAPPGLSSPQLFHAQISTSWSTPTSQRLSKLGHRTIFLCSSE